MKLTTTRCSETYPDELEFLESGIYVGRKGETANKFTLWDAGEYEVLSEDQVRISTANDEEIVYRFAISGATLKFVDEDECEFQYRQTADCPRLQA